MYKPICATSEYATAICAIANTATVNCDTLKTPIPNCEMQITPQPNCPIAMMPRATTGVRLGRNLKAMCRRGRPAMASPDLYSHPHPSQDWRAGYGAPQLGQERACSEI